MHCAFLGALSSSVRTLGGRFHARLQRTHAKYAVKSRATQVDMQQALLRVRVHAYAEAKRRDFEFMDGYQQP